MDITKLIRSAMMSRVLRGYEFAVMYLVGVSYLISCSRVKGENRELVEVTVRRLAIKSLEKRNWCV